MKAIIGVCALLAICLLSAVGCKRSGQAAPPVTDFHGAKVDWPKLDAEFVGGDSALQATASKAKRHIRYERFPEALAELEKLASNPSLTEGQKKVVAELTEQTKQAIATAPPPGQ